MTVPPSGLAPSAATLNGRACSFGLPTTAWFEWGTSTNFGNLTPPQELGNGFTVADFSAALTGLGVGSTYHFRAVASNQLGVLVGAAQSFSLSPSVATWPATALGATTATFNGTANPKGGASLSGWFEWGFTTNYGNLTPPQVLGNGSSGTNFSEVVSNLLPGSTVHFRAAASDGVIFLTGGDQSFVTPANPADRAIPGSVNVTLQPPEAVADGASWSLDGGPAQPPGIPEAPIPPGAHTVRFGSLAGWRAPPAVEVFVVGGKAVEVAAEFTRLPTYDFRDVPEQQVRQGESVAFFVSGSSNEVLQVSATPPPTGALTFDPASGRFSYTPAAADRLPFSLTFSAGGGAVATSVITPLPNLPDGGDRDQLRPAALPDEESRDYITISEGTQCRRGVQRRHQPTLTVEISGKTLVFDASHPANLYLQYNGPGEPPGFRLCRGPGDHSQPAAVPADACDDPCAGTALRGRGADRHDPEGAPVAAVGCRLGR